MSAALQLGYICASAPIRTARNKDRASTQSDPTAATNPAPAAPPVATLAFYRRHTESLLRRYLYASMLVGRTPAILAEPLARGWAACRTIRTFEDAIIFVLDVERCLSRLGALEREMLGRVILQSYTQSEAAMLIGMSARAMAAKYPLALDHLTELLLHAGLLQLPHIPKPKAHNGQRTTED